MRHWRVGLGVSECSGGSRPLAREKGGGAHRGKRTGPHRGLKRGGRGGEC